MNTCRKCDRSFNVDFMLTDKLWDEIRPIGYPELSEVLCGKCIVDALEERCDYGTFDVTEICSTSLGRPL